MGDTIEKQTVEVQNVLFAAQENGFCIFKAMQNDKKEYVAKGHVGAVSEGDEIIIWGEWEKHPKFGPQVKITRYQLPDMASKGTLAFLSSGFIKGVGPALAKEIWNTFGEDTARIMDEEPRRLLEVSGIGKKKLETITNSWQENRSMQEAIVKFQEWGIGPVTVQKIFKKWPDNPLEVVQGNPFVLAWEIDGVGFLTADKIAVAMGVRDDAPERIRAGINYVLQEAASKEGHCYLELDDLVKRSQKTLLEARQASESDADTGTLSESDADTLIREQVNQLCAVEALVRDGESGERIYSAVIYQAEQSLGFHLRRLLGNIKPFPYDIDALANEYERRYQIKFDDCQREAITSALNDKVCIITGGPGTGKTTIVNAILDLAKQSGLDDDSIGLVAPTGRAAKRLEESSGHSGQTIHRYLGFNPQEGFQYDAHHQVSHELIVCDEASMLDTFLAKALTAALPSSARLILVGDVHQLPSVGAGNVLRDCIRSGEISVTELDTIHRQGEGSWIVRNAHAVKDGQTNSVNLSNQTEDFFWEDMAKKHPDLSPQDRSVEMQKRILDAMRGLQKKGYDPASVQVLTPMYKGPVGVTTLNTELQAMLNPGSPDKAELKFGFKTFREGDRVMQLKNDYDKEVFNGDQGWITEIDTEESRMHVEFDGRAVTFETMELDQLVLAYACTIHKSQGCEFPVAIIPVTTSHYIMLQRNLLYTAITRAKQLCFLLGEKKALGISVKNNKPVCRNTTLESLLKEGRSQPRKPASRQRRRSLLEANG